VLSHSQSQVSELEYRGRPREGGKIRKGTAEGRKIPAGNKEGYMERWGSNGREVVEGKGDELLHC